MNARRVAALIGKETRELVRDPITVWLALLMPLVMLFLFGYAVTLDVRRISLGVYDQDGSPASRELVDRFTATSQFAYRARFDSPAALEAALQRSDVSLALVIPPRFQARLVRGEAAPVQVLVDGAYISSAALAAGYAEAIVRAFPRPDPGAIEVQTRIWFNPSLRSAVYIVPGLFAVILMAFPPLLTALALVREKETGTIQQIYASPVTSAEFIAGKLVPYGLVALLEMAMLVVIGTWWFDVPFVGSPGLLFAASLIYVFTTVSIGLLVSAVTRTQLTAMMLALIVTLMPSFLFSGFLFPVFTMPLASRLYSAVVPASHFIEISRGIVLKGAGISAIWPHLAVLGVYTAVVFAFAVWRLKQKVAP
jgi:ABC-2 type transport system permease protein